MDGQSRSALTWERVLRTLLATTTAIGVVVFIEPAPYEAMWVLIGPLLLMTRNVIHVSLLPITFAMLAFVFGGFISLTPHWDDKDAVVFQIVSLYLFGTFLLFAIFFSDKDTSRLELALRGYAIGCFLASCYGIAGHFNIAGLADHATMYGGRVRATFKDPNVFGSHMIPGAVYLLAGLLTGRFKRTLLPSIAFGTIFCAVLLSMSRGSIGGMVIACLMAGAACFITGTPQLRKRIVLVGAVMLAFIASGVIGILSVEDARELLLSRLTLFQDYDIGARGRFDNQSEAILLVPSTPLGLGPQQFAKFYGIEPHSNYIGAFISYGWIGGLAWLALTGASIFVAIRLMIEPSPYRAHAHIVGPCVIVLFLQAFQIDIDHWRFFFFCLGALWGLEAARCRWQATQTDSDPARRLARRYPNTAAFAFIAPRPLANRRGHTRSRQ